MNVLDDDDDDSHNEDSYTVCSLDSRIPLCLERATDQGLSLY